QLIACKQGNAGYRHFSPHELSRIAPAVPPVSVHQCQLVSAHPCHQPVPISATSMPHTSAYQCTSMPHISAHLSCLSVSPISASQCHLSITISATYQCCQSVPPIS
ncbi:unnamed protein product, partial [Staurois parvus]